MGCGESRPKLPFLDDFEDSRVDASTIPKAWDKLYSDLPLTDEELNSLIPDEEITEEGETFEKFLVPWEKLVKAKKEEKREREEREAARIRRAEAVYRKRFRREWTLLTDARQGATQEFVFYGDFGSKDSETVKCDPSISNWELKERIAAVIGIEAHAQRIEKREAKKREVRLTKRSSSEALSDEQLWEFGTTFAIPPDQLALTVHNTVMPSCDPSDLSFSLRSVRFLDFSLRFLCQLDYQKWKEFNECLREMDKLEGLRLDGNALGKHGLFGTREAREWKLLCDALVELPELSDLSFQGNALAVGTMTLGWSTTGAYQLGLVLPKLQKMRNLDLAINSLGDKNAVGLKVLAPGLAQMPLLERLDLSGSAFAPTPQQGNLFCTHICELLKGLTGLKTLVLAGNPGLGQVQKDRIDKVKAEGCVVQYISAVFPNESQFPEDGDESQWKGPPRKAALTAA